MAQEKRIYKVEIDGQVRDFELESGLSPQEAMTRSRQMLQRLNGAGGVRDDVGRVREDLGIMDVARAAPTSGKLGSAIDLPFIGPPIAAARGFLRGSGAQGLLSMIPGLGVPAPDAPPGIGGAVFEMVGAPGFADIAEGIGVQAPNIGLLTEFAPSAGFTGPPGLSLGRLGEQIISATEGLSFDPQFNTRQVAEGFGNVAGAYSGAIGKPFLGLVGRALKGTRRGAATIARGLVTRLEESGREVVQRLFPDTGVAAGEVLARFKSAREIVVRQVQDAKQVMWDQINRVTPGETINVERFAAIADDISSRNYDTLTNDQVELVARLRGGFVLNSVNEKDRVAGILNEMVVGPDGARTLTLQKAREFQDFMNELGVGLGRAGEGRLGGQLDLLAAEMGGLVTDAVGRIGKTNPAFRKLWEETKELRELSAGKGGMSDAKLIGLIAESTPEAVPALLGQLRDVAQVKRLREILIKSGNEDVFNLVARGHLDEAISTTRSGGLIDAAANASKREMITALIGREESSTLFALADDAIAFFDKAGDLTRQLTTGGRMARAFPAFVGHLAAAGTKGGFSRRMAARMLATGAAKSVQRTYTFLARRAFGDPDALSTAADISRAARSENEGALARALVRAASLIGRFAREEGEDIVLRELVGEEEQQSGPPLLPDPAQFSRNPAQLLEQQSRRPPLIQ